MKSKPNLIPVAVVAWACYLFSPGSQFWCGLCLMGVIATTKLFLQLILILREYTWAKSCKMPLEFPLSVSLSLGTRCLFNSIMKYTRFSHRTPYLSSWRIKICEKFMRILFCAHEFQWVLISSNLTLLFPHFTFIFPIWSADCRPIAR